MNTLPDWLNPTPWLSHLAETDLGVIKAAIYAEEPSERELALMLHPRLHRYSKRWLNKPSG